MKCPFCNADNTTNSKFCNQCGYKLIEIPVSVDDNFRIGPEDKNDNDDFFDAWRYYESGDYELATELAKGLLETSPESTSLHSLIALIYEKKAQRARSIGADGDAQTYLYLAIAEYERILEINPNSSADKEKMEALKDKLFKKNENESFAYKFLRKVKAISIQLYAALIAFVVVVLLLAVTLPKNDKKNDVSQQKEPTRLSAVRPASKTHAPQEPPKTQETYTPSNAAQVDAVRRMAEEHDPNNQIRRQPMPAPKPQPQQSPEIKLEVKPAEVPPAQETEKSEEKEAKKQELIPTEPIEQQYPTNQPTTTASEGNNLLGEAQRLFNAHDFQGAWNKAYEAKRLFERDLLSGKNPAVSRNGIENAERLMRTIESM